MMEKIRAKRAVSALVGEVWALEPNKLLQVADFAQALMEGKATSGELFARVAGESDGESRPYAVLDNGVAIISADGVIARRLNLFSCISGGVSTQIVGQQLRQAAEDGAVRGIILDINSPGGGVFGLSDLASLIREVRETKPVVAFTPEMMCSAAYWIGSAASEMVCTEDAEVGSVGVACMHFDRSGKDAQEGVKRTMITAGKYKRIASDEKPLSAEGLAYLQERVDHYFAMFVDAVAVNRTMAVEDVLEQLADGSTHIGTEALAAGFVDHVGNLEFAIERTLELIEEKNPINSNQEADMPGTTQNGAGASGGSVTLELSALTAARLAQENPGLAAELTAAGVNDERQRVVELMEAGGDAERTLAAVKDGTDPKVFYKQVLEDERSGKAKALETYESDMSDSAGQDGKQAETKGGDDFDALVKSRMEEAKCTQGEAMRHVARKHPAIHAAWLDAQS